MGKVILGAATILATVIGCFLVALNGGARPATQAELKDFEQRVNVRLDRIEEDLDTVKERLGIIEADLDTVKERLGIIEADLDSLKAGQIKIFNGQKVIFEEVKKKDSNFWSQWFN